MGRFKEKLRRLLRHLLTDGETDGHLERWHLVVKARSEKPCRAILTNLTTGEVYVSQGATPAAAVSALRTEHGIDPQLVAPVITMRKS